MTIEWSRDPALAAAQRRRERGPRIAAHADTHGLPPDDMTDVDCGCADLEPEPVITSQRLVSERGTEYSIAAIQHEPLGNGTARRLTEAEVLERARNQCHDWISAELGVDPATRPELATRLEPRDLGHGRIGVLVDEVLRASLTRK